jgi:protein-disulfide isomerase
MSNSELKAEALDHFNAKDYNKSLDRYQDLTNQGLDSEKSSKKALEWCRKAAFQGYQKSKDIMHHMQ